MVENTEKPQATNAELEAMIAATDTGARSPAGNVGKLIVITAFFWSLFQLWIASPLPCLDVFSSWLPVSDVDSGKDRLQNAAGLELREEGNKIFVDNIVFGSAAAKQKIDFDWEIVDVQQKADRPDKRWFYIPAILLLVLVWKIQSARRDSDDTTLVAGVSNV